MGRGVAGYPSWPILPLISRLGRCSVPCRMAARCASGETVAQWRSVLKTVIVMATPSMLRAIYRRLPDHQACRGCRRSSVRRVRSHLLETNQDCRADETGTCRLVAATPLSTTAPGPRAGLHGQHPRPVCSTAGASASEDRYPTPPSTSSMTILQPVPVGEDGCDVVRRVRFVRVEDLNRPDKTAERFRPAPVPRQWSHTMFDTGDLGRFRPDGSLDQSW